MELELRIAARLARSRRESFPHARIRLTPAAHQDLAEILAIGTDIHPLSMIVESLEGVRVEIDPDVPTPGWTVDTWQ
jgi:hypothetical protein